MKYFLDTSSLVKIYHKEKDSDKILEIYRGKGIISISELSKVEFVSTIYRKSRENEINLETLDALEQKFRDDMENRYQVFRFSSLLVEESENLIRKYAKQYSLKTLDSLQVAFFKTYCEEDDIFVCSDIRLCKVLALEHFSVLC